MVKDKNKKNAGKKNAATFKQSAAPVSKSIEVRLNKPKWSVQPDGATRIANSECVLTLEVPEEIWAPGGVQFHEINPGLQGSFPWLWNEAKGFDFYIFRSLRYRFLPLFSTSQAGIVGAYIDYDARDEAPADFMSMMSNAGAVQARVWDDKLQLVLNTNSANMLSKRLVRSSVISAEAEPVVYDAGVAYFTGYNVAGQTAGTPFGQIYVDYVVDFYTPHINTELGVIMATQNVGTDQHAPFSGTKAVGIGKEVFNIDTQVVNGLKRSILSLKESGRYVTDITSLLNGGATEYSEGISLHPMSPISLTVMPRENYMPVGTVDYGWAVLRATVQPSYDANIYWTFAVWGHTGDTFYVWYEYDLPPASKKAQNVGSEGAYNFITTKRMDDFTWSAIWSGVTPSYIKVRAPAGPYNNPGHKVGQRGQANAKLVSLHADFHRPGKAISDKPS